MQTTLERKETAKNRAPAVSRRSRARLQVRARGVLLGAAALFVLSQAGLRGYIEEARPEFRDPTFEIKYRRYTSLKSRYAEPPATVMFLGSSMTIFGMNAGAVDQPASAALGRPAVGFNLGAARSGPFAELVFLQRLLRRGARPDFVVLELAPICLGEPDVFDESGIFPAHVVSRADLPTVQRYSRRAHDLREEWWQAFLLPVHAHRIAILNQTAEIFVPAMDELDLSTNCDDHGWRCEPVPSPEHHRRVLERLAKAVGQARFKVGERRLAALHELAELLAQERIPTLMVSMPEGPMNRSTYPPGYVEALGCEFARLSRDHGFPLIDARTWMGEEDFVDSLHLSGEGAKAFTERLTRDHLVPWIRKGR